MPITASSVEECLQHIESGDRIFIAFYGGEPRTLMRNLHKVAPSLHDVELWKATDMEDYPVLTDPSLDDHIRICSIFYGRTARKYQTVKKFEYMPNDLHMAVSLKNSVEPCNVFMASVSPMDSDGYFTLGPWAQCEYDVLKTADKIILEVNPNVPRTYGDTAIHISQVTCFTESNLPVIELASPSYTPVEEKIGDYIADLVQDGDCIQLGIGGTSNVVARNLKSKKDLGIHSEMFTDSMMELIKAGAVNGSRKNINTGKVTTSFSWGSRQVYDFIDGNKDLEFRSSSYVNDPSVISANDNMVSINTAMEVDLTGQICSESIGHLQYSGTGGAFDFAYGALHSKGGRGIIALPSTAKGGSISKIKSVLTPGAAVSIPRNTADIIVTEYGVAYMRGRTIRQRAQQLIQIAHPDFREQLKKEAESLLLW